MALKTAFTMLNQKNNTQYGFMTILSIVFTFLFIGIMVGIFDLLMTQNRLAKKMQAEEIALPIAEAGINYYRWHLTQDEDDYTDGTGVCVDPNACGPYTHDYSDPLAPPDTRIGQFELYITPPPPGSTLVTIKSIGRVDGFPNQSKTIEAQYGIPSLAKYAILSDAEIWIMGNENVSGPIHSNFGIRMDGNSSSIVSSALSTYICNNITGCNPSEDKGGIWGTGSGLWQLSAEPIDLTIDLDDLNQMREDAQMGGIYYADSGAQGYKIIFHNNSTFDVYKINELKNAEQQYNDDWLNPLPSIGIADEPKENKIVLIALGAISNNGLIFIEDDVWVEGTVNGRFTLVSAKLTGNPENYTTIRIGNDIQYLNRDGTHILGLIAEKDIKIPKYVPDEDNDNLIIDAILWAQNGKIFRNQYQPPSIKPSIEVYGSIIAKQGLRWKWCSEQTCNSTNINDGYSFATIIRDTNAEFYPPPYFPNIGKYIFVSWKEKVANQP